MINQDKWIGSLPKFNKKFDEGINQLDHDKWTSTIPKKNTNNSLKKYSLLTVLFVCGLLLVSVVKNKTRNLQKEINNLEASVNLLQFNLEQEILDNEVITSPENISYLAKEYLNTEFVPYKRSQIEKLNYNNEKFTAVNKIKTKTINNQNKKKLSKNIKKHLAKKIDKQKIKVKKIHKLYSDPKKIPKEIKKKVAIEISEKKVELRNIYDAPKEILTLERFGRWTVVQLVKAFFGMPVIPGK